jgi:hypothetical protein
MIGKAEGNYTCRRFCAISRNFQAKLSEVYVYSSAIDYAGKKGLHEIVVIE